MEDIEWKRDETPYLIFACNGCHGYSYVKTTQRSKKCLRCGRSHQVQKMINEGEIINGMTNALNKVKSLQNEFGFKTFKGEPDFESEGSFRLNRSNKKNPSLISQRKNEDRDELLFDSFLLMLEELSQMYKAFPKYIIEIMAENKNIPQLELANLMRRALKEGHLMNHNEDYILKRT
ncbi:MAG: hypothetical protein KGD73_05690 [Candidatus Lokiarchaeota archaeon]|nr:hypothetical protein [Candidatus Lokiarchaeota archaeon]